MEVQWYTHCVDGYYLNPIINSLLIFHQIKNILFYVFPRISVSVAMNKGTVTFERKLNRSLHLISHQTPSLNFDLIYKFY